MHTLTRFTDNLLDRLVPRLDARAANGCVWQYCYCSRGVAYRRQIIPMGALPPWICTPCTASGAC
jgi:hypothetical protein